MKEYLLYALGIYLLIVNLWAFALMGIDKRRAKKDLWRVKETALFLPVLLGGGVAHAGQFLLDAVREAVKPLVFFKTMSYARIELARLGNDAGIIGAAMLGRR